MKQCKNCKQLKDIKEFHKNKRMKDGHLNHCIECRKKYDILRNRTQERINYMKQLGITYYNQNKEEIKLSQRLYKLNNKGIVNNSNTKRRINKFNRTPKWLTTFDLDYIKHLYVQAKELEKLDGSKYHVDHIVPLHGKNVCGLHVPWNLQILSNYENSIKSNKFDGTYENKNWLNNPKLLELRNEKK
jgi:hypothetical protein